MSSKSGAAAGQAEVTDYRNSDVRYGAHCPGIVQLLFKDREHYIALTGIIVNLSVTGCLFSNDKMPWANKSSDKSPESIFDIIEDTCRLYLPWINTYAKGKIRRLGSFIIGIEFDKQLNEALVKSIASLEPNRKRRFEPVDAARYNRVLPIAPKRTGSQSARA